MLSAIMIEDKCVLRGVVMLKAIIVEDEYLIREVLASPAFLQGQCHAESHHSGRRVSGRKSWPTWWGSTAASR